MGKKHNDPKSTQKQIAQQLSFSDSSIKCYKYKISMPSPIIQKAKEKNWLLKTVL